MSQQQYMNQDIPMPNGLPPNWCGTTPSMVVPPPQVQAQAQKTFNPHMNVNNGLGSSHSSRDSSPGTRSARGNIPASQLPPGRQGLAPGLSPIPYNLGVNSSNGHTSVASVSQLSDGTPHSSPKIQNFSTSTPTPTPTPVSPPRANNVQIADNTVNKPNLQNPQNQPNLMNTRTNLSKQIGQQQQSMIHSSSTPALQNLQGASSLRQDLNQPQTVPRPLSSGPQLQQTSQQPPVNSQSYNYNTAPLQRPQQVQPPKQPPLLTNQVQQPPLLPNQVQQPPQLPNQVQKPPLSNQVQQVPLLPNQVQQPPRFPNQGQQPPQLPNQVQQPPQLLNQVQQPPLPNQVQQPPLPNQVQQPPHFPSQVQQPSLPNQMQQVPQLPNQMQQPLNQYQPPSNQMRPPVQPPSSYPTTPVSNLHTKRYPQPVIQQNPNANLPPVMNYNQQQQQQQQPQQIYNQPPQYGGTTNYQQQQQQQQMNVNANQQRNYQQMNQQMQNLNVTKSGFNKMWGHDNYDLLQCPNVLPEEAVEPPKVSLGQEFLDAANCSHEIFRCTMTKIPENNSLLQKSRLPLGVLIHPFKDLNHLPVIQCNTIVRCRACRTYINPFIFFVDTKRWKCNLCYRVNELPEEFQYDPVSKSYGDPSRRPEIKSSTIEYIAPSEYMLRPPQPAVYLFLLDISRLAVESGYLHTICDALSSQLATLPGDARTQIGFIAYNTTLHFFNLAEGLNQPHEMIVTDVDDVFLPCPDNLLVNLKEHMDLVTDLLAQLPTRYQNSFDTGSALGAALQAAFKMMSSTGGRVTVFQVSLPTIGPGALTVREDPNQRAGKEAPHLNPATDFYKRLALDCSGHQVAVDLFILNSQYVDIATLSGISRFSGGCMHHFPLFKASKTLQAESLDRCFKRYLNRKIGFEAVMRIRCTRGLSIHTFHGNFFVRSTDLLSLPNVNPDAGFGMQVSIEESLADLQSVCFQAALLYTSSKGERRIRVHTLCLPVVNSLSDILNSADQQCIVGILSKMAVDRSLQSSLSDARDAFINVAIDILSSYKLSLNMGSAASGLMAPQSLKLLPIYILALLKYTAFRTGQSTRLDDRVFAMCDMKTLPLAHLIQLVYPDLYPVYRLAECPSVVDAEGLVIPQPRRLQLTARNIDSHGAYILDSGQQMFIYVCPNVSQQFLVHSLGVPNYNSIPDPCYELQTIDNPDNQRLHAFINSLNDEKPYPAALQIIRDNSASRSLLLERLIEDRIESALSYNEFLQHLKTQVK